MQAISTTRVGLAGFFGEGLRLPLGPLQTQAPRNRDRVHEDQRVLGQHGGIAIQGTHLVVMRLAVGLVVTQRGVRAADVAGKIAAFLPGAWPPAAATIGRASWRERGCQYV